jgi:hypothetical protein
MKNFVLSSLACCLIIFITSCTSTQFSSTGRSYKNGHVVYKNKHQKELRNDHARNTRKHKHNEDKSTATYDLRDNSAISQMPGDKEMVIASTSDELSIINIKPVIINTSLVVSGEENYVDISNKTITVNSDGNHVSISPDTTIKKQDTINYVRGTVYQANQPARKIEGLGLAGTITGTIGLFIAGIPLGILSVIFGVVCVTKVKKNPKRFMGKGLGIAAIILGIVDIVGALIVLSM